MLPKCRSNTLTVQDRDELLADLRKMIPGPTHETIDKILKGEENKDYVTLETL